MRQDLTPPHVPHSLFKPSPANTFQLLSHPPAPFYFTPLSPKTPSLFVSVSVSARLCLSLFASPGRKDLPIITHPHTPTQDPPKTHTSTWRSRAHSHLPSLHPPVLYPLHPFGPEPAQGGAGTSHGVYYFSWPLAFFNFLFFCSALPFGDNKQDIFSLPTPGQCLNGL